ncbi:MAG: hypothetical protein M0Z69_03770 [Actinomycetota bacterium]|nr:hypothetical protein [Actinomycetota bacterium]
MLARARQRLCSGDLIAGVASAVLLVALFLPWYRLSINLSRAMLPAGSYAPVFAASATTSALGTAAGGWRYLILLLCLGVLGYLASRVLIDRPPRLPAAHRQVLTVLTGLSALLDLLAFVAKPAPSVPAMSAMLSPAITVTWSYGAFVGIIAGLAALGGALLARDEPHLRETLTEAAAGGSLSTGALAGQPPASVGPEESLQAAPLPSPSFFTRDEPFSPPPPQPASTRRSLASMSRVLRAVPRAWRFAGAGLVLVAVAAVAVTLTVTSGSSGSASPRSAVTGFVRAFGSHDLAGALRYLDPKDRPSSVQAIAFGNAVTGEIGRLVVRNFATGPEVVQGDHAAVLTAGTVCVPGTPCQNLDALLAAVARGYGSFFSPSGPGPPTGLVAIPCIDSGGGWYVYGGDASWVPDLQRIASGRAAPSTPNSTTPSAPPTSSSAPPPTRSTSRPAPSGGPAKPAVMASQVQEEATTLDLPAGASLYVFGYATGGAVEASDFAAGEVAAVADANGNTVAEVALGTVRSDSFTTSALAEAIAGVGLSGFSSYKLTDGANGALGASSATTSFTVSSSGSLAVVVALAGGEQSLSLRGLPGMKLLSSSPPGAQTSIQIADAHLGPGSYTVSEVTSPLSAASDPANQGDLVAVVVLAPGRR